VANIRSDTNNTETNGFTVLFIKPTYLFSLFFLIEMREKLHSQRETVILLPKL